MGCNFLSIGNLALSDLGHLSEKKKTGRLITEQENGCNDDTVCNILQ